MSSIAKSETLDKGEVGVGQLNNSPNVILFGQSGVGKSSIVNMLDGEGQALISNGAVGQTFKNDLYQRRIKGRSFNIFDTAGLGEADVGTVPTTQAIQNLYDLVRLLKNGISLLVLVIRPRVNASTLRDYNMFYDTFCDRKVPIVVIVTGLENYDNMEDWWEANSGHFPRYGVAFKSHACVTTTKGKEKNSRHIYQEEYDHSKLLIEKLIEENCAEVPWTMQSDSWFRHVLLRLFSPTTPGSESHNALIKALEENGGMTTNEAKVEARKYAKKSGKREKARRISGSHSSSPLRYMGFRMRRKSLTATKPPKWKGIMGVEECIPSQGNSLEKGNRVKTEPGPTSQGIHGLRERLIAFFK
ncbi:hypothetical protein CPB86DRAFT_388730 [Serendipita vermifera]|nr:hypothetical protein CPB86DRAFT_388730 [Serendipita vermifera]